MECFEILMLAVCRGSSRNEADEETNSSFSDAEDEVLMARFDDEDGELVPEAGDAKAETVHNLAPGEEDATVPEEYVEPIVSDSCRRSVAEEISVEQLELLIWRQEQAMPGAMEELRRNGRKTGHWAWWAFPTEKPGSAEPYPGTKVTVTTAPTLLLRAPKEWREVLELIVELVDETGDIGAVVPPIDHGRIIYFIKFWRRIEDAPTWLLVVCSRLDEQLTSPALDTGPRKWPRRRKRRNRSSS